MLTRSITGALVVLVLPFVEATPSIAGGPTCQGQPATIVGTPRQALSGTAGPDVIVTNGASPVESGAGDDRVCITGRTPSPDVDAGAGDDRVTDSSRAFPEVDLGAGDDHFRGLTTRSGEIDTGDDDAAGHDVVIGGPGHEVVRSGVSGEPNDDVIELGGEDDIVDLAGVPTGSIDTGPGKDMLLLESSTPADWVVDLSRDIGTVDGRPFDLARVEELVVSELAWRTLHITGSEADESVYADRSGGPVAPRELTARMGGGDDAVRVTTAESGPFHGGPGRDAIEIQSAAGPREVGPAVRVDLPRGHYRVEGAGTVAARSFSSARTAWFESSTIIGTASGNRLHIEGCSGRVEAGPGDDRVGFDRQFRCPGPAREQRELRAYGQAGDDVLWGGPGIDRLIGGPGRDQAWALDGRDVCRAERERYCEA